MGKFKQYDRIRVTKENPWAKVGEVGTVLDESSMPFVKFDNGHGLFMYEENIELLSETLKNQIHITTKGTDTIAVLTDGKKEIRRAVAKCSPSDEFDFEVGAKLAFARLVGEEIKKDETVYAADGKLAWFAGLGWVPTGKKEETVLNSSFDWEAFKLGKIAVNCDTREKAEKFLKECEAREIKWPNGEGAARYNYGAKGYSCSYGQSLGYARIGFYEEEGYQIVNYPFTQQVKEVKRAAKVGDHIKIVKIIKIGNHIPELNIGDIHIVTEVNSKGTIITDNENAFRKNESDEYVVLENYTPSEPKSLDLSTISNEDLIAELQRRLQK